MDEDSGSWAKLRSTADRLSLIIVKRLEENAVDDGVDQVEQYRLGKVALECIDFRRSLLEHRPGPKWTEEQELTRMEQQVSRILSRSKEKKELSRNDPNELKRVSRELHEFWRRRSQSKNRS